MPPERFTEKKFFKIANRGSGCAGFGVMGAVACPDACINGEPIAGCKLNEFGGDCIGLVVGVFMLKANGGGIGFEGTPAAALAMPVGC